MQEKSCFGLFMKYASLNVLGMIALSCYILADTFFVSLALGANGLTALNLAIPVYSFINGSGLMIGMGGGIKYSILKSQGNRERGNQIFTNGAVMTAVIAGIFFLLGIFAAGPLIRLLGADDTVYEMGKTYLRVILVFAPMFMTNNLLLCFIRNDGAPQLSMAAMIGGSLSNVVLDYVFMFPLKMGIFGAAFATGLAPVISIGILSPYLLRKKNQFHLKKCRILPGLILGIFSSGLPSLITEVSSGIVIIVFNMIILGLAGNTGVAAYGVIANLSLVVIAIYTGISQGIQPLMSSFYGAGNRKNIKSILRYAMAAVVLISAVVYLTIFFGADPIAAVFNSEQNPTLQSIARQGHFSAERIYPDHSPGLSSFGPGETAGSMGCFSGYRASGVPDRPGAFPEIVWRPSQIRKLSRPALIKWSTACWISFQLVHLFFSILLLIARQPFI